MWKVERRVDLFLMEVEGVGKNWIVFLSCGRRRKELDCFSWMLEKELVVFSSCGRWRQELIGFSWIWKLVRKKLDFFLDVEDGGKS